MPLPIVRRIDDTSPDIKNPLAETIIYILSGVELKFKSPKFGETNKGLSAGSEIKIYGQIEKYVDFDE